MEGYFFQSVLRDCVSRNEKRAGKEKVRSIAIAAISNKLEMPGYDEGFDALCFVRFSEGGFVVDDWRDEV